jgi:hypothetical protein
MTSNTDLIHALAVQFIANNMNEETQDTARHANPDTKNGAIIWAAINIALKKWYDTTVSHQFDVRYYALEAEVQAILTLY